MELVLAYVAYLCASAAFAAWSGKKAYDRAELSGSTHYAWSLVICYYDFWVGAYYDVKKHRVYVFPVPFFGIMVDYSYDPPVED